MSTGFTVFDVLNKNSKEGVDDQSPRARFRTKDISVYKMYGNEMNFYSIKDIEALAQHILMFGLKQNLELMYAPCEKGEYKIIAGERRWRAIKLLIEKGHKEFEIVTCKLTMPQDDDEEQIEIIIANTYRDKTVVDMIEEEQRLKESLERMRAAGKKVKGYDLASGRLRDVIASILKMSKTKVAQIESVNNNLIPEFKEEMKKERITFSAAYELSGMTSDKQREALAVLMDTGELEYKKIKEMKEEIAAEEERAQIEGQMSIEDAVQQESVSDSDTVNEDDENGVECEGAAGFEEMNCNGENGNYQAPHPEGITSLCYSCTEYETCDVKTGTCTSCDQYRNRAEENKTEEQRYAEEQSAIDQEVKKKLCEKEEQEKIKKLPSETGAMEQKVHQIKIGKSYFKDACTNVKNFELRKNDRDYKVGDILELMEFDGGENTGRMVRKIVTYMLEDYTGLDYGFCIMATELINERGEIYDRADLEQICKNIRANTDGHTDAAEEFILVEKAISLIVGGKEE